MRQCGRRVGERSSWSERLCALALVITLAGCGQAPPIVPHSNQSTGLAARELAGPVAVAPDYQQTLIKGADGKPTGSWYDSHGANAAGDNQDARDLAALPHVGDNFYGYLTEHSGPVAIYVGGNGEENSAWTRPFSAYPGVPSIALNYSLNAYVGIGQLERFWSPVDAAWRTSWLDWDGPEGLPHYRGDVRYGTYLLDRLVEKLKAAGAKEVWVFGHSKGADITSRLVYAPDLKIDHRHDDRLTRAWAFSVPLVSPAAPWKLGFHSKARHWGGFFKGYDGKLLIYNRDSDFVTYGGWIDMATHDYNHLVEDDGGMAFPGPRGHSPAWGPGESFMGRLASFVASGATSDQSPETLSYDW